MTLDRTLDTLHAVTSSIAKATRRRRRIRREDIVAIMHGVSTAVMFLATIIPQARPVADAMNALRTNPSVVTDDLLTSRISPFERKLLMRLQALQIQLITATGEQQVHLNAQRELLLDLVSDQEQAP